MKVLFLLFLGLFAIQAQDDEDELSQYLQELPVGMLKYLSDELGALQEESEDELAVEISYLGRRKSRRRRRRRSLLDFRRALQEESEDEVGILDSVNLLDMFDSNGRRRRRRRKSIVDFRRQLQDESDDEEAISENDEVAEQEKEDELAERSLAEEEEGEVAENNEGEVADDDLFGTIKLGKLAWKHRKKIGSWFRRRSGRRRRRRRRRKSRRWG